MNTQAFSHTTFQFEAGTFGATDEKILKTSAPWPILAGEADCTMHPGQTLDFGGDP